MKGTKLNSWWIDTDRALASGNPTDGDLADLRAKGFAVLVSLIDEDHERPNYDVAKALAAGWTRHKIEIPESATPSIEQVQEFARLIGTAPAEVKILIHCGDGAGRAATMGAVYWISRGLPVAESIERIRAAKGDEWLTEDRRPLLENLGIRVNDGRIKMIEKNIRNVIIIGSGPAGYTAAVYSARANLKPLLIASEPKDLQIPGGQLMFTEKVENFPGFAEGVAGPELMEQICKQAQRFGTEIIERDVEEVDFVPSGPFRVRVQQTWYTARSVIVATGATAKWLNLPNEMRYRGRGLSACAVCDGPFFRGQNVMVVGGGDTAIEEALTLARNAARVTIVHRRDTLRASRIMQDRAAANRKIEILRNTVLTEYIGNEKLEAVRVKNIASGEERREPIDGVFMAIGHNPNTGFLHGALELHSNGYIVTHDNVETSVEGVFAAGDVHDNEYRQAVTAAGFGCMAALRAERWLESGRAALID